MRRPILVATSIALLTACQGGGTTVPVTASAPAAMAPQTGTVDSDFIVKGRYIEERLRRMGAPVHGDAGAVKFFIKGMDYSPTPIGKGVADPPALDDPLRDGNMAIWSRDLPKMRAMGVNAVHVYNVVPPPHDKEVGPISKFLNAAWNGGKDPIYVVITVHFPGAALLNRNAANDLAGQYYKLDEKYAAYPAVLGVAISNEIVAENFRKDLAWWENFNIVAQKAKEGFAAGGDRDKLVMTSEADGSLGAIEFGEKNNAKVDVWGVNIYRGRTFTNMFEQIQRFTKKPVILTEYGATAAYHPAWKNAYTYDRGLHALGFCTPTTRDGPLTRDVQELPDSASANPNMAGLVDYVTNDAKLLYYGYKDLGGRVSGGFYFEWTDEWWKADNGVDPKFRSIHVGSLVFNGHFPGCGEDAAWYGLNAIAKGIGVVDILTPRPTFEGLKDVWATQQ